MTAAGVAYHYRPQRRTSTEWMERALCKGWPHFTELDVSVQISVCRSGCPTIAECALYGVDGPLVGSGKDAGGVVYGAMRPRTIKRLQKARGVSS